MCLPPASKWQTYKEIKVLEINRLSVTFSFGESPNDMNMLAMLGGELNNSATYFSTFGNPTHGRTGRGEGGGGGGSPPICWTNKASRAISASKSGKIIVMHLY